MSPIESLKPINKEDPFRVAPITTNLHLREKHLFSRRASFRIRRIAPDLIESNESDTENFPEVEDQKKTHPLLDSLKINILEPKKKRTKIISWGSRLKHRTKSKLNSEESCQVCGNAHGSEKCNTIPTRKVS